MRFAGVAVVVLMSACIRDDLVDCGNGVACPSGTACATLTQGGDEVTACVSPSAVAACAGLEDHAACSVGTVAGSCQGGACLPSECGNLRIDLGEVCDDGNTITGDGCSFGCLSDERCGNGVIDPLAIMNSVPIANEQCDDGNLLNHDGCSSKCQREALRWEPFTISLPAVHHSHALAYDSGRDRIVMFGGAGTGAFGVPLPRSDTWESDGVGWIQVPTSITPPARYGHVLAYDPIRHRTLLFGGGSNGTVFDDTWEWDGTTWTLRSPAVAPPARRSAAAVYDPVRERIVVFGGEVASMKFADTWEWDGATWLERKFAVSPEARSFASMAFDPIRGVSVLAGGSSEISALDDTWEYDGTTWTLAAARLPALGPMNGMAFDGTAIIAFGTGTPPATSTFRYDGQTWSRPLPQGALEPTRRSLAALVSDPRRMRVLLVEGFYSDPICPTPCPMSLGDVWEWDRAVWRRTAAVSAPALRTEQASSYDDLRGCLVIFGGGTGPQQALTPADTWELCGDHWTQRFDTQPPARVGAAMAYDPDHKVTVLFGGRSVSNAALGDTWVWNGTIWTAIAGSGPPARADHAMAFDPVSRHIVLSGGFVTGTFFGDTWEWDGASSTWSPTTATASPRIRAKHALGVDPIRAQLFMLGGDFNSGTFADQWNWDGATWAAGPTNMLPPARSGYDIAWNAPRRRSVMFGGSAQFSVFGDIWESTVSGWAQQFASGGPLPRSGHSLAPRHDGVVLFGGFNGSSVMNDLWRLRWDDDQANELCTIDADTDGDGLAGCADPDCWGVCAPLCPPGATCAPTAPRCGDSMCNAELETCRMCPGDCGECAAACGDNFCDPGETAASCKGDCS